MIDDQVVTEHVLYRLFDATDKLLYVGITNNITRRFADHARRQPWWSDVTSRRTEFFRTRDELEAAEITAIVAEKPIHNRAYNFANVASANGANDRPAPVGANISVRNALHDLVIEFTSPVGRRLTMSEVVQALVQLGRQNQDELVAHLTRELPGSRKSTRTSRAAREAQTSGRQADERSRESRERA